MTERDRERETKGGTQMEEDPRRDPYSLLVDELRSATKERRETREIVDARFLSICFFLGK